MFITDVAMFKSVTPAIRDDSRKSDWIALGGSGINGERNCALVSEQF
jgi:hypothetical protein